MALGLNNLKVSKGSKKTRKRLGRGNSSGAGNYSGRGQKGQRARSGGKGGLKLRGLKELLLRSKPKIGGFKSLKPKMAIVNISQLEESFEPGVIIDGKKLIASNLIKSTKTGVKILGDGKVTKKFTVIADAFSKTAKEAILKVGGKAELRGKK